MASFIFVRHGESQANADRIIADAHSPLSENGLEQARRTGYEVKDKNISLIVCSPYLRAQQTAEIIAGELGIDITHIRIIDSLRERGLGQLENNPKNQESPWYINADTEFGLESKQALYKRMQKCLEEIAELSKQGMVLVVGHAISGFYLLQATAKKASIEDFDTASQMSNADFIEVDYLL